jgi:hypothetical protein
VLEDWKLSPGQFTPLPVQFSATSQMPAAPRHGVAAEANWSAGHAAAEPVQFSATSQMPADGRHGVAAEAKPSLGQVFETPLQDSTTSQMPAEPRQGAVLFRSVGQSALDPVQFSARSQTPAEARHGVDDDATPSLRQVFDTPSQDSTTSQMPAEPRQGPVLFWSLGQTELDPVQFSARSQAPAEARHGVEELAKPLAGHAPLLPLQVSCTSHVLTEVRQTLPAPRKVQFELQQEVAVPLAAPWSHCSPVPSTTPLPQNEV